MNRATYPNTNNSRTPLLWVAEEGHEDVVKLLLEREDIDPNTLDARCGLAPLEWAAQRGDDRVVKFLLERGYINPNTATTQYCLTPLLWAAKLGHVGVVKLLLKCEDINPNAQDTKHGRTPLVWAVENRVPNGPTGQVSEARPDGQSKLMSVTRPGQ